MREKNNSKEIKLDDSDFIVSRTDLNGAITYVNDDFCRITGYSKSELIGANHNIIRHPDMPASFFSKLWKTIKAGEKFKGYIKNRAKDGGYYWVDAEITPYVKDGKKIGYKSVRKKPSEQIIKQCELEYEKLKKDETGEFSHWVVKNENYEEFNNLSKELNISKSELFSKMLEFYKKSIKK